MMSESATTPINKRKVIPRNEIKVFLYKDNG
jgi:hypothetical protein